MGAKESIRKAIKKAGQSNRSFLFYYFGHGIKPPLQDKLYLYFPDSDLDDPGSMLDFSDIVEWFKLYEPPEIVVILDCCYAGTVASHLNALLTQATTDYYLMASVNPTEKALLDYGGQRAYGIFSKYILQAFKNPGARAHGRDVTFKSFFKFAHDLTFRDSKLKPYSADNNLADTLFFRQTSTPVIHSRFRTSVPKKSIYRKLYVLARELWIHGTQSERYLYSRLRRRRPPELLQPRKNPNSDSLDYEVVSPEAFHRYLRYAVILGILEDHDLLELTPIGREMMRNSGERYNKILYNQLEVIWKMYGFQITDFEDACYERMKLGTPPSFKNIYRDITISKALGVPKDLFRVLFDLTGYVGALNYSADKTFFPSVPDELAFEDS